MLAHTLSQHAGGRGKGISEFETGIFYRDCSTKAKEEERKCVWIKYIISTKVASIYTTGRHKKKLNFRKSF